MARIVELRQLNPGWSMKAIVEHAQEVLEASRRRPVYPPLVSWANRTAKVPRRARKTATISAGAPALEGVSRSSVAPSEVAIPATGAPLLDSLSEGLVQIGVQAGSSILAGVLRHPAVQQALAGLVADVLAKAAKSTGELSVTGSDVGGDAHLPPILIVGLSEEQAHTFARGYQGVLDVRCDAGTKVTRELRLALGEAGIVIGMDGTLSLEVKRLLAQMVPSYVRHTSGLTGLRHRLAELALAGDKEGMRSQSRIGDVGRQPG